jgi:hypothetical protein
MKSKAPRKTTGDPVESRRDWVMFSCYAHMHVSVYGGPIHKPHTPVLQLLIQPWKGDHEAWTVYRHPDGIRKNGKIVFKKWNREADLKRFRALGQQEAPKDWMQKTNVTEQIFHVSGRWVANLERAVGKISIPLIAGPVQPLSADTEYKLSLWRGRQESEFSWHAAPPKGWRPLANLFGSLLRNFRAHTEGKPFGPIQIRKLTS